MKTKPLALAFAFALGVLLPAASTHAACYTRTGPKWCTKRDGLYRVSVSDRTSSRWHVTTKGVGAWNGAGPPYNKLYLYKIGSSATYYNIASWGANYGNVGWAGLTTVNSAYQCFSGTVPGYGGPVIVRFNQYYAPNVGRDDRVVTHEFGHALGFDHVSGCGPYWTMYSTTSCAGPRPIDDCLEQGAYDLYH
jgi:hypothetical protein